MNSEWRINDDDVDMLRVIDETRPEFSEIVTEFKRQIQLGLVTGDHGQAVLTDKGKQVLHDGVR